MDYVFKLVEWKKTIWKKYGIEKSGCTTKELIKDIYNIEYKLKKEGKLRHGCHCLETRDIGAYDSCPNGCKYCYANQNYKVKLVICTNIITILIVQC